jgi:hypothetical protein
MCISFLVLPCNVVFKGEFFVIFVSFGIRNSSMLGMTSNGLYHLVLEFLNANKLKDKNNPKFF